MRNESGGENWEMEKIRESQPVSLTTQRFFILRAADQHVMLGLTLALFISSYHGN